jgi:tetratricopeptide (TPR) repeat protein
MPVLAEDVHELIAARCKIGDTHAEKGNYEAALADFWAAWDLLPDPPTDWAAATWILGSVGDANFLSGDYAAGRDNLSIALTCPDGLGNPFLHLRLGQCQYELGEYGPAADNLARAFMTAGGEIFANGGTKYLQFLTAFLEPPAGESAEA